MKAWPDDNIDDAAKILPKDLPIQDLEEPITSDGDTPLVWALEQKNVKAVQYLLDAKADPNLKDPVTIQRWDVRPHFVPMADPLSNTNRGKKGRLFPQGNYTPLHHVIDDFSPAYNGYLDPSEDPDIAICKLLLGAKADANQTCSKLLTPYGLKLGTNADWRKHMGGSDKDKTPLDMMMILVKRAEEANADTENPRTVPMSEEDKTSEKKLYDEMIAMLTAAK